jgi:protease I
MKKFLFILFLLLIPLYASAQNICMIIAQNGFRDEELFVPKEIFKANGIKVTVVSSSLKTCRGMLGAKVEPDRTLKDIIVDEYDAIIFVGGRGATQYWNDPLAHKIAKQAYSKGKIVGAICLAPVTLANAGILKDKKATVWRSARGKLIEKGAVYTGSGVERDENIITADGPGSAEGFGMQILQAVKSKK